MIEKFWTKTFYKTIKPMTKMLVSEWADKFRFLSSKAAAEPGQWRTSRTPYLKEVMDELSSESKTQEVVFMKGAQIGATESGNNWLGYIVDRKPGPTLIVWPTTDVCKKNSRVRLDPLVQETPNLSSKIKDKRSRDSENTMMMKTFPGGFWALAGANSGAGLRSLPCRYVFCDEIDDYPGDLGGEGDPVNLAKARTKTFGTKRKLFYVSTPIEESKSRIAVLFENSDKRYFLVPCPDCKHEQKILWPNIKWTPGKPETAELVCVNCGVMIPEHKKSFMLANGKWVAENPGAGRGLVAGFHLSGLYSPLGWYSWADAATEWERIKKQKDKSALKVFVNTVLGETWQDEAQRPEWENIYSRREPYKINTIPDEKVIFLTAGVDIQKNRIEIEIVGWGREKESWSIDYRVLTGETSEKDVWKKLEKILGETWKHPNGYDMGLRIMAIDSGFNTQFVYEFCRKFKSNRVAAVKGSDTLTVPVGHPKNVDLTIRGKVIKSGLMLWGVGSSLLKSEIYGWLENRITESGEVPFGYCHFPEYETEFFKQLTGEELRSKIVNGRKKFEWVKIRDRNEALDCRVYARAGASIFGIDRFNESKWKKLEVGLLKGKSESARKKAHSVDTPEKTNKNKSKPKSERRERRKSDWI